MRKNTLRVSVMAAMVAGFFLAFTGPRSTASEPGNCPESKPCCQQKKKSDALKNLNVETMSGQFFTFAGMN
ncbi:MAG TPA: hypothetical protein VHM26_14050 [Chitinophagaceae bacterium]|jgi:hypothetical protein|nr:hypothetical protein [Chitinophagaceae bacterium]